MTAVTNLNRLFSSPSSGPALRVPVNQVPKFDISQEPPKESEQTIPPLVLSQ